MNKVPSECSNEWDSVAGYNLGPDNRQESDYAHKFILLHWLVAFLQNDFVEVDRIGDVPILDVGCGNGILACDLVMEFPGIHIHGIDSSDAMIDRAKKNISHFLKSNDGSQIDFKKDDAQNLSLENDRFGISLHVMLLQTVDDEQLVKIILETNRVLRPNGVCYVVIPNPVAIKRFRNLEQAEIFDESLLNKKLDYHWRNEEGEVIATTDFYVRTVEFYIKSFLERGFSLSARLEPIIENTNEAYESKKHIFLLNVFDPMFVILKFAKSGPEGLQLDKNEG